MTSKKLGALLRSVPPATAAIDEAPVPAVAEEPAAALPPASPASPARIDLPANSTPPAGQGREEAAPDREVPLQVLIPAGVRRQLALHCAQQGESLRSVMLRAIRSLGLDVTDADIAGKRGRKNY